MQGMAFESFQESDWLLVPPVPSFTGAASSRRRACQRFSRLPLSALRAERARPSLRTADSVEGAASMPQNKRLVRMALRATEQPSRCARQPCSSLIVIALCLSLASLANAEPITKQSVEGNWIDADTAQTTHLYIAADGTGTWEVEPRDGTKFGLTAEVQSLEDGVMNIVLRSGKERAGRVTLGGWIFGKRQVLFGTWFVYGKPAGRDDLELINGIDVSFERPDSDGFSDLMEVWAGPPVQQIDRSTYNRLLEQVVKPNSEVVGRDQNEISYRSPNAGSVIVATEANPAYPAIIFIAMDNPGMDPTPSNLKLIGRFAGSRDSFILWRAGVSKQIHDEYRRAHPLAND